MNSKKISVIIPAYGEEEYIGTCIESVVNQTYKNLEIILVDDGSPDKCPLICDEWAAKDERIRVLHKENGGLVSARKAGIQVATGEYVGYVDGDDWIEPDMYKKMIHVMETEDVDIVISGFKKDLFGKSIPYVNKIKKGVYRGEHLVDAIFPTMICDNDTFQYGLYTYVWNKLFKKDKIFRFQMNVDNRITIGEDAACVYPALLEVESIAITEDTGYHYRQRMNSMLRQTSNGSDKVSQLHVFYDYMKKAFENSKYRNIVKKQTDYFYLGYLIMLSDNLVKEYPALGDNFPFFKVERNSRIIIYSAGAYGMHVYKQFSENENYEIVAWGDPDYEKYIGSQFPVISLQEALKKDYDYLIVASIEQKFIIETVEILKKNNVKKTKIVTIKETLEEAIRKLKKVGVIGKE